MQGVQTIATLRCRRCGATFACGPLYTGCSACASRGQRGTLEVIYPYDVLRSTLDASFWKGPTRSIWHYRPLLPVAPSLQPITLGEGNTPLVASAWIADQLGLRALFFKNETANPTWSHKDRGNAVAVTMAQTFGHRGVTATSTGNHGASIAAYAARAGLECVIVCPPETSTLLLQLIQAYGAHAIVAPWDFRPAVVDYLIRERGFSPISAMDAAFTSTPNPYGPEGYKTIAYEIVAQLGRAPDRVFIPCASGNLLYGVWKGFRELVELGQIVRPPRIFGCQPATADALARSLRLPEGQVAVLEDPSSIATSTREKTVGLNAVAAVRESGGDAVVATDEEILATLTELGHEGFVVEPASGLSVAGAIKLARAGVIDPDETVVCLLTSAGIKWPAVLDRLVGAPAFVQTIADLERALESPHQ